MAQILLYIQEGKQSESEEREFEEDTKDIDLMASDNEDDEEEIESENEQNGAFLDDEREEQEDVSFNRRFHVELDRDQSIPVPLHDRTSSYRVYCQQKQQSHVPEDRLPEVPLDLYLSHSRVHLWSVP